MLTHLYVSASASRCCYEKHTAIYIYHITCGGGLPHVQDWSRAEIEEFLDSAQVGDDSNVTAAIPMWSITSQAGMGYNLSSLSTCVHVMKAGTGQGCKGAPAVEPQLEGGMRSPSPAMHCKSLAGPRSERHPYMGLQHALALLASHL